ncbi:MAG: hypothetical protein FJ044_05645 [Candidatus Cloacimonetes bacterium]|nr:hypothetical protein [Candidatus Cloacimonadota bacterium]
MLIRKEIQRNLRTLGFVGVFVLTMFISVAQAEQICDFTFCVSLNIEVVSDSEELRIATFQGQGIVLDNLGKKLFHNMTFHLVGVARDMFGKRYRYGFVKFMDPDGDFVFTENIALPDEKEGRFKFLLGTGKWKGIKGEGKVLAITSGKPIKPGTTQTCWKLTGTFELAK